MAKKHYRRQVGMKTTDGNPTTIGRVSSNGCAAKNARAKGSFGKSHAERLYANPAQEGFYH